MAFGLEIASLLLFCAQGSAQFGQDLSTFIGSHGCRAELRGTGAGFGLALDRKQRSNLETRELGGKTTLLVIQYANDADHCGTIRDIVVARDSKDIFGFECIDHTNAGRVVIGIHQGNPGAARWKASRAWYVDFDKLKLIPTDDYVTCLNYDYSGPDDGSDIRTRAATRTKNAP